MYSPEKDTLQIKSRSGYVKAIAGAVAVRMEEQELRGGVECKEGFGKCTECWKEG